MSESPGTHGLRRLIAEGVQPAAAVRDSARPGAGMKELVATMRDTDALIAGVGPVLAPFVGEEDVSDVLVNSTAIWVDRGRGLERSALSCGEEIQVRALAVRMAAVCGKRLDEASPIVDGTLPGGVRLHAVLPPLSAEGTLISLRTSRARAMLLDDMVKTGSVAPRIATVVKALVQQRANTLISGSTGSGKTTLLATVLGLVPPDERIVCIEEVSELRPDHPHVVHLQERRANVQGAGSVSLTDLVRAALRMRPDRIILGECRGPEVRDVLGALNTGHDGGWATIHANTVEDVPARLAALGALAGMSDSALAAQGASAFDAVIQMRRDGQEGASSSGGRWVSQVGVLSRRGSSLECSVALEADIHGTVMATPAWEELAERVGVEM